MNPVPSERRAHPRYPIGFGAAVSFPGGRVAASTRDVSVGGCLLESERPIPEAGVVELALRLTEDGIQVGEGPPLRVLGTIRWTAEAEDYCGEPVFLSGVQFDSLTGEQRRWLEAVIVRYGIS